MNLFITSVNRYYEHTHIKVKDKAIKRKDAWMVAAHDAGNLKHESELDEETLSHSLQTSEWNPTTEQPTNTLLIIKTTAWIFYGGHLQQNLTTPALACLSVCSSKPSMDTDAGVSTLVLSMTFLLFPSVGLHIIPRRFKKGRSESICLRWTRLWWIIRTFFCNKPLWDRSHRSKWYYYSTFNTDVYNSWDEIEKETERLEISTYFTV